MSEQHDKEEILSVLENVDIVAVATLAGNIPRIRMMHYAVDKDFNLYLATMKGLPKSDQITNSPAITLLVYQSALNINESSEVEITGQAFFVIDQEQRKQSLEMIAKKSPIIKNLIETENSGILDCIKVAPDVIKFRIFEELAQGASPTVIEFPLK
jgi:uncharacterized pyridoxamine 5'-phosphate oxidase family protein